jgi:hypothetical protein
MIYLKALSLHIIFLVKSCTTASQICNIKGLADNAAQFLNRKAGRMAFLADKEELKPELVILRRLDIAHRNWYCQIKHDVPVFNRPVSKIAKEFLVFQVIRWSRTLGERESAVCLFATGSRAERECARRPVTNTSGSVACTSRRKRGSC